MFSLKLYIIGGGVPSYLDGYFTDNLNFFGVPLNDTPQSYRNIFLHLVFLFIIELVIISGEP